MEPRAPSVTLTRETVAILEADGAEIVGFGSILNRGGHENPFAGPYEALLRMQLETFAESDCRLCAAGVPLDAPGSRFTSVR